MDLVIMETSSVVLVLESYRRTGRGPPWFESRLGGGLCVPRAVESEFKKILKANRRGRGRRPSLAWMSRLPGAHKDWIYGLYRDPAGAAGHLRSVERMHGAAAGSPDSDEARAWMASKRARLDRMGIDARAARGGDAKSALRRLYIEAGADRAIMAQAVAIARASPGPSVLVSRDGDFVAFSRALEEISGGSMRVARPEQMP